MRVGWVLCLAFWYASCAGHGLDGSKKVDAAATGGGPAGSGGMGTGGLPTTDALPDRPASGGIGGSVNGTTATGGATSPPIIDGGAIKGGARGAASGGSAGGAGDAAGADGAGPGSGGRAGAPGSGGGAGAVEAGGPNPSVKSIAVGRESTYALLSDGTLKGWGYQPFVGMSWDSCPNSICTAPVPVPDITNAVAVASSEDYTCALLGDGTVTCWGMTASEGELCDATCHFSPGPIDELANAVGLSVGVGGNCAYALCAARTDGTVVCLHDADDSCYTHIWMATPTPLTIAGITSAIGLDGSCARLKDQTVACWDFDTLTAIAVAGVSNAVKLAGNCALLANGRVACWAGSPPVATLVPGVIDAVAIASYGNTCAVLKAGTAVCWQGLGDGSTPDDSPPAPLSGIANAIDLSLGPSHQCVLLREGGAKCWGDNFFGQLGDGSTESSDVPVAVQGL